MSSLSEVFAREAKKEEIRKKCFADILYFANEILGYKDICEEINRHMADRITNTDVIRKVSIYPRGTFKSTLLAVTYTLWRLVQDPMLEMALVSGSMDKSKDSLREIKSHIERDGKFKEIFGDLKGTKLWAQESITIRPADGSGKASVSAFGVNSQLTGKHFKVWILDDIVTDKDRDSALQRKSTKAFFHDVISLLQKEGESELNIIGTFWYHMDLYNFIIDTLNPELLANGHKPYDVAIRPVRDASGNLNYPSHFPEEILSRLMIEKGTREYNSQYMLNPLPPDSSTFDIDKMRTFTPGELQRKDRTPLPGGLDWYGFCDPALGSSGGDFSAVIVIAVDKESGEMYVTADSTLERLSLDALAEQLAELIARIPFTKFGIEGNSLGRTKAQTSSLFEYALRKEVFARNADYLFEIIWHNSNKQGRIEGLQPDWNQGTLLFADMWQKTYPELILQFEKFDPLLKGSHLHDDGPDATAGCVELIKDSTSNRLTTIRSTADNEEESNIYMNNVRSFAEEEQDELFTHNPYAERLV